jgi:hypothetical protein
MLPRNISDWHFEQIIRRNWGMMLIPKNQAGAQHSLSPYGCLWWDDDGTILLPKFLRPWSITLIFQRNWHMISELGHCRIQIRTTPFKYGERPIEQNHELGF